MNFKSANKKMDLLPYVKSGCVRNKEKAEIYVKKFDSLVIASDTQWAALNIFLE